MADHAVGELVGRFRAKRDPVPAISLNNPAALTCIANDWNYENVFSRQIDALANNGDILFALSTSGNSPNVNRAVWATKERGILTVGMTGEDGGQLRWNVDVWLPVMSGDTAHIQAMHLVMIHYLCGCVDDAISD